MIYLQTTSEVLNITSGNSMKVKNVISQIRKLLGRSASDYVASPYRAVENVFLFGYINKAKKLPSFESSTSFFKGILKSIIYYKSKLAE